MYFSGYYTDGSTIHETVPYEGNRCKYSQRYKVTKIRAGKEGGEVRMKQGVGTKGIRSEGEKEMVPIKFQ